MLACIACSKQLDGGMDDGNSGAVRSPASKDAVKNLTAQIKDVALRLSGSNRYGKLVAAGSKADVLPNSNSSSTSSTPKFHNALEELEEEEEGEGKEWTSEFETGIMITLVSGKDGRNELKRIRFCREMFNKTRAQVWWAENHEKLLALYNVRTPVKHEDLLPRSQNEEIDGKVQESAGKDSPVAPPAQNNLPVRPAEHACANRSDDLVSSSDNQSMKSAATNSCEEEEEEEEEADQEREWMEEDEPGVYITIRYSPLTGAREVKRVRFSREKFSEMQARLWWEDNRRRIQKQYIDSHNV